MEPQKTAGLLRERGWVADDEKGLLKVFYNQDVAARICFAAGWFSASEEETSVLEQVEFFHRRTFAPMPIEEAPDILYSEVMRDVELAVAAAAGGQGQAASHSVMEMRRAIVELNLPLKRLKNVILEENHALIKGAMADYTVHLGSGVVQIKGGDILNIQPVHSILRGRLFLPFVDEDPETAEIMSKIILLAEDKKIKDPLILEQINRPDANDLHNKTNI